MPVGHRALFYLAGWRYRIVRQISAVVRSQEREVRLEHDPEKWVPVVPRDKRGTRLRRDHAQIKEIERDDDSKKNHPAPALNAGFHFPM
jgi:hypothetical protein